MTAQEIVLPQIEEESFQYNQVLPISTAHFVNDIYQSCVTPLLPLLIEKLSLTLTQAGSLIAIMQLPALFNPFIGYLADKVSVRYFIIFAPAITGTAISLIGFAPSYFALAVLLFCAGVSTAAFHAPAPAMVSRVSGKQVGLGMSMFMAGGELSFTLGPLLAVWAVSTWTLSGFWRIIVFGWAATVVLYWRLHNLSARPDKPDSIRMILPSLGGMFIPLGLAILFRNPLTESLSTYLPIYMKGRGASLLVAGAALSVVEVAGFCGVLLSGPLSDRMGRKRMLLISSLCSTVLMLAFLRVSGWLAIVVLLGLGFATLSSTPIILAMVQEQFPKNRAMANGLYMMLTFVLRLAGTLTIGILGDRLGLQTAFFLGALISLLAIPAILVLPDKAAVSI